MKFINIVVSFCLFAYIGAQWNSSIQGENNCLTPDYIYGVCVPLKFCPQVINIFQRTNQQIARQYLFALQRVCGTRSISGDPVICCTRPDRQYVDVPTTPTPVNQITTKSVTSNPFFVTTTSPATSQLTTTSGTTSSSKLVDKTLQNCRDPNGEAGECIALAKCQSLVNELYAKQKDVAFANFLRLSNAICGGSGSIVCCPIIKINNDSSTNQNIQPVNERTQPPTVNEGCGNSKNSYRKIVGGEPAKKGSWPWIALIGYDDDLNQSAFKCGGTLVTSRHVVTAAHCLRSDLSFVRLGEHDLETETESKHIDVKVAMKTAHPNYNKNNGRADIALLYLEKIVIFTDNISPICLPIQSNLRSKSYVKHSPFVAGWGKTMMNGHSATVLQQLQISILENEECKKRYAARNRFFSENQFDAAVICAGVLAGGKDTCQGDSGGPLMIPEPYQNSVRYYLIGVVSYGIGCAQPEIPGVYSSVQYFIDWILTKISESP